MYAIEFYEDSNGVSDVWNFLEKLRIDSSHNKDARIQYKQVGLCIQLLQDYGTRASSDITKYIGDGIWELRPGSNRVLYFCTISEKRLRRRQNEKSKKQSQSAMITFKERNKVHYENLE